MTTKLVAGLLIAPLVFVGLLATADYAVVDVREGGPDGMHLIVPVPLSIARMALTFAPDEAKYVEVPEIAQYLPYAERVIEELRGAPDGILVQVEERGESVRIEKVGEALDVHVNEDGSVVDVTVPLDAVIDVLRAYDGRGFDTRDVIRAVGRAHGNVVHVKDGEDEVKVWIW